MRYIRRPLTEAEILRCRANAEKAALPLLEGNSRALLRDTGNVLAGEHCVVLPIGKVSIGRIIRRPRSFVIKICHSRKLKTKEQYRLDLHSPRTEEHTAAFFRMTGFPVPTHHVIEFAGGKAVITEDLGDKQVLSEADGFDFNQLRNGRLLQRDYDRYLSRLETLYHQGYFSVDTHVFNQAKDGRPFTPDLGTALRRMFFVRVNQNRNTGELIMGDLGHSAVGLKAYQIPAVKQALDRMHERAPYHMPE